MNDFNAILAKSKEYGLVSLLDHTQQVLLAAEHFCDNFNSKFEPKIVGSELFCMI